MECIVRSCTNQDHQGNGIFLNAIEGSIKHTELIWICIPCWLTLKGERIEKHSQLYRNVIAESKRSKEWKNLSSEF